VSAIATLTVQPPPVASITVAPSSASLVVGESVSLVPTVKDASGALLTDRTVSWPSSSPTVATVLATGLVTAVAPGSASIVATSGGRSGSASVTVVAVPVGSVAVSPASVTLVSTQVTSLSAIVRDANDVVVTDRAVIWSSSNTAIAIVSSSGSVTAVAPGVATATATSEGRSGSASISVVPMPVGSVAVSPATPTIMTDQTITLSVTVRDTSGTVITDRVVTWSSSDETIATVSSAGVVTGVGPGTATITATSEGRSAITTVTVQPTVACVSVAPSTVFLRRNSTVQLSVTAYDAAGHEIVGRTVTWSTDNDHAATVSQTGLVRGEHAGTATISATIDGKTGSTRVTVTN
jgi:trimeric autotransporter adhesin